MKYPNYRRYTREDLIEMYNLNEDEQTYLLDELLAVEEYVYENYIAKEEA